MEPDVAIGGPFETKTLKLYEFYKLLVLLRVEEFGNVATDAAGSLRRVAKLPRARAVIDKIIALQKQLPYKQVSKQVTVAPTSTETLLAMEPKATCREAAGHPLSDTSGGISFLSAAQSPIRLVWWKGGGTGSEGKRDIMLHSTPSSPHRLHTA